MPFVAFPHADRASVENTIEAEAVSSKSTGLFAKPCATDDTDADISKELTLQPSFATGEAVVSLSSTDTDIDYGSYFYDIQYKDTSANIVSSSAGKFIVAADITRSS